jgi:hypothetical protein
MMKQVGGSPGERLDAWSSAVTGVAVGYVWFVGAVMATASCPSPGESAPGYRLRDEAVFEWVACPPFLGVIAALGVFTCGFWPRCVAGSGSGPCRWRAGQRVGMGGTSRVDFWTKPVVFV